MINYGTTRGTEYPKEVDVKETLVFVASNVHEVTVTDDNMDDEPTTRTEYEFDLVAYTKDEYIEMIDERNKELENELTSTELALCEVYELIGG